MNEKPGTFELLEPAAPESLIPASPVEPWMIVLAVLVVLAGVVLAYFLMRKRAVAPDPRFLRQAAREEAVAALQSIGPVPPREAAVLSSLILRKYLSVAAGDPALFETHEEYVSRHEALKDFSEEARGSAGLGFARLASMKYAADSPDLPTPAVIDGSRALLEVLHRGFRA